MCEDNEWDEQKKNKKIQSASSQCQISRPYFYEADGEEGLTNSFETNHFLEYVGVCIFFVISTRPHPVQSV